MKTWVNGQLTAKKESQIPVEDTSFLYGCGLFETVLLYEGRPIFIEEHLQRMKNSAETLGLSVTVAMDRLKNAVKETIHYNKIANGSIRITLSESGNVAITTRNVLPYEEKMYHEGVAVTLAEQPRVYSGDPLLRHKTTSYMTKYLLRKTESPKGYMDVILKNEKNQLAEGCISNIFFVKNETIVTPPVEAGLLPGIVRDKVFEIGKQEGISILKETVLPAQLHEFEEVFITNSLMGILPVRSIDTNRYGSPYTMAMKIRNLYEGAVRHAR